VDRASLNAEAFDRVTERVARLYYDGADAATRRARWQELRDKYRPLALQATSNAELEAIVHRLVSDRPPLREAATGRAAVSSAHPVATGAGVEILQRGGNVVDAAVAVSFALGVVEPDASGIGGYGQMLIATPDMETPSLIEFMTRAPEEAAGAALLPTGDAPDDGPVLANVPGTVAGMELAHRRYGSGRVPWRDLLAPAIRAAEHGFVVSDGLATTLARERERFLRYPASRALFFPDGRPLAAGDTLRNPDLAWVLQQVADSGAAALYHGEVGRRMVADLRGGGNVIRMSDLERYYAVERAPVSGTYRGHTVYSSAPPVAGGATLIAQLNLLEQLRAPRPFTEDAATLHAMIEAWKLAPSAGGRIADPGLWPVELAAFVSKDAARVRWRCFDPQRALTGADVRRDSLPCLERDETARTDRAAGTTAFAVADAAGNVVAVTQTLGTWGGNFYVTPGLGFLYNDKLTAYPEDSDRFGARLAHARHGSSIAPTIVYQGTGGRKRPVLATGAAGNQWITSAVYAIVTGVVDQGLGPQQAIELPRFLPLARGEESGEGEVRYVVQLEDGFAPDVLRQLRSLGHEIEVISLKGELRMGYAAAVTIEGGRVTAAADPRRSGAAGAVRE
jgi:gamma-glutamyltranspeptidase